MKIHVIREDANAITGYTKVPVSNETINFEGISNNECEFIMANQVMDLFRTANIGSCLTDLVSKLRMGGTLVVGGTDLRMFCINTINGMSDPQTSAVTIGECHSMTDAKDISNALTSLGLTIVSNRVNGNSYEVTAKR